MILNLLLQANPVTDSIANTAASNEMNASVTENISYLDFLLKRKSSHHSPHLLECIDYRHSHPPLFHNKPYPS